MKKSFLFFSPYNRLFRHEIICGILWKNSDIKRICNQYLSKKVSIFTVFSKKYSLLIGIWELIRLLLRLHIRATSKFSFLHRFFSLNLFFSRTWRETIFFCFQFFFSSDSLKLTTIWITSMANLHFINYFSSFFYFFFEFLWNHKNTTINLQLMSFGDFRLVS